jgi:hypothetical protein
MENGIFEEVKRESITEETVNTEEVANPEEVVSPEEVTNP